MKPLTLNFTTFLKICTKTTRGKIGDIRRFTGKGGYDFYKVMKKLASKLSQNEITLEGAKEEIAKIVKDSERDHTLAAIERLELWLNKHQPTWSDPPEHIFVSPSGLLKINLKPELGFKAADGKTHAIYLWNLAQPTMKQELAGEGLWLLADELGKPDNTFEILDLRAMKLFTESAISVNSGLQLKYDLMLIEEIWKDIHTPSMSAEDTLAHISSLKSPPPP